MKAPVAAMHGVGKYAWTAGGLAIIACIAWLNRVPDGMIFSGGDVLQYFDREFVDRSFRHIWSNFLGEGFFSPSYLYYPFYVALFAVSDLFGLDPSREAILYVLFVWGGSYIAWLFAHSLRRSSELSVWSAETNLLALLYALNPFTFYAFYFIWGYSPFLFIYVVFPVIATATLEYFAETERGRSYRLLALLFFTHALATIAYTNLSFFVGLNVVLGIVVLSEWLFERRRPARSMVRKAFAFFLVELAATSWAIVPQLPNLLLEHSPTAAANFSSWILWQRLSIWEVLTLNPQAKHYVANSAAVAILALGVMAAALLVWIARSPGQRLAGRGLAMACGIAVIVLIESKGRGIVPGEAAIWAFANPLLGALRSNGKVAIFLPFLVLFLMSVGFSDWNRRLRIGLLAATVGVFLISAYPMATGGLQKKYSVGIKKGEVCDSGLYCYLNRIPSEYRDAAAAVRRDGRGGKILSVPYSVVSSVNWTYYPSWKHIGVDPTVQLFNLPVVQVNTHHLFGYIYGREWEEAGRDDPQPLLNLAADLGASYVLFHKDVYRQFLYPSADYLPNYERLGALTAIFDSPIVTVYRVAPSYLRPTIESFPDGGGMRRAESVKLSPAKYVVTVPVWPNDNEIVLREGFSSQWRVHVLPASRSGPAATVATGVSWWESFFLPVVPHSSHARFARYGNRWRFDGDRLCNELGCAQGPDGQRIATLVVEYAPQRYVYLLQLLSVIAAVVASAAMIFRFRTAPGTAMAEA